MDPQTVEDTFDPSAKPLYTNISVICIRIRIHIRFTIPFSVHTYLYSYRVAHYDVNKSRRQQDAVRSVYYYRSDLDHRPMHIYISMSKYCTHTLI